MSLHLGNDFSVFSSQVLAILNLQNTDTEPSSVDGLEARVGSEKIRKIGLGKHVSAVLSVKGTYYLTPIDSQTLVKRFSRRTLR